jgi:hypothetical protein
LGRKLEKDTHKISFPEFYQDYVRKKRQAKQKDKVIPIAVWRAVIYKFINLLIAKIVSEGFVFHIPYGCGSLRLNQRKYSPNGIVDMLRLKAWDRSFYYHWDKTTLKFYGSELRVFRPSDYMMTQKKKRILLQNDDPYLRDLIAHASNRYDKRLEILRQKYKEKRTNEVLEDTINHSHR